MTEKRVQIGKFNRLAVIREANFGVYLDGLQFDDIVLPKRFVPDNCQVGELLDVFVYLDSDDCLIATTLKPFAQVGEFAHLKVKEVNAVGAFMDWGLPKDLLCPFGVQKIKMAEGKSYIVCLYQDEYTRRIVASSKLNKFLSTDKPRYKSGESVSLLVSGRTDLGYTAIINNRHEGLIFENDIQSAIHIGDEINGFIKRVRSDGKIDLSLKKIGYDKDVMHQLEQAIMECLEKEKGFFPMNDRSSPELIKKNFNVSKRAFKMALGGLYKQRKIIIEKEGIRLLSSC
ncbi:Conserved virulence factor B [invertebrate metagenome]|uniref:Conserved virulence factor B n=1 Tax=invertebrate metagenome TaxID=1711999 RepID=A0A2H9T4L4_9ZZZZ